ncbi:uncharacterized protein LOC133805576 [Humulus lupulus]|uniref:uncharacterized protein LOC133805576 n=1 Tax=Humulus lupulus TaxID=3486 RepID=UPI002B40B8BB|nr:uncharacterized protein LOC133805576 [Humulus lupulus]
MAFYQANWDTVKTDVQAVFDDWDFLGFVLDKKGFGAVWRKWMLGCWSSTSFSVFLNGRPRGKFKVSRGLLQGDSLSPFLFILRVDVLGRMVDKAKSVSALRGFKVGKDFVEKCQLLGINLEEDIVELRAKEIGCEVGQWPMKYLGLPLGASPHNKGFWEPVISSCAKCLDGWKCVFLSRGGRLTLIQSILSSIPVYYMSFFCIPKGVVEVLEKLIRDFLWEGADHSQSDNLVSWKEVCKSRDHGGFGIGNLDSRNNAFLMKWPWRFSLEKSSLWHRVVMSRFKVGKGDRIRFWEDIWINDAPLKLQFPDLFFISLSGNCLIKDMVVSGGKASLEILGWDLRFRRNLFKMEVTSLTQLLQSLVKFLNDFIS